MSSTSRPGFGLLSRETRQHRQPEHTMQRCSDNCASFRLRRCLPRLGAFYSQTTNSLSAKAGYPCHKRKHQDDLSLFKIQHYFYGPSHTSPHYVGNLGPKKVRSVSSPLHITVGFPFFRHPSHISITVGSLLPLRCTFPGPAQI